MCRLQQASTAEPDCELVYQFFGPVWFLWNSETQTHLKTDNSEKRRHEEHMKFIQRTTVSIRLNVLRTRTFYMRTTNIFTSMYIWFRKSANELTGVQWVAAEVKNKTKVRNWF